MNSNDLIIKQKQKKTTTTKQTNKQKLYMKTEQFQNSIVRLSFLYCITDIEIAWINLTIYWLILVDKLFLIHKNA